MIVVNGVDGERSRRVMQAQEAVEVEQSPPGVVRRRTQMRWWWERVGDGGYENRTHDREE
jgi:hypothetical protein